MSRSFEVLLTTLVERFANAGFVVPNGMNQDEKEVFVFHALIEAAIVPADEYQRLVEAGRTVVELWERGNLAEAVRNLSAALTALSDAKTKVNMRPNDSSKPRWYVEYSTTVHADSEEEACALAERDFAHHNCVVETRRHPHWTLESNPS